MNEPKKDDNKKERRFSQEQYEMLKRCSEKEDMTEWNEWRMNNREKDVLLEGALLDGSYLESALLNRGMTGWGNGAYNLTGKVYLEDAWFNGAHLEHANLNDAHLEHAWFCSTHLEHAWLEYTHLEHAVLENTHLEHARLWGAHLEHAWLLEADLQGANLSRTYLQGADFSRAIVDGETLIWRCKVDRNTDFRVVGLDNVRIDADTKQLLKYNIRRMNWEDWYKGHWFWRWPVRAFWAMSDYAMSTIRVIGVFFILALLFAAVYVNWAYWAPPGIVSNLIVRPEIGEAAWHYFGRALLRPVYFSIVTMTTLGFGDMYANKGSIAGHVILAVQVILGYVLLGALVTRFAVLFTVGGPAGKFAEEKKKNTK